MELKKLMTALYDGEILEENEIEELRQFINQKSKEKQKMSRESRVL